MRHFQVETPYLAAAAKGSNLRVVIEDNYASVHAFRGEVEVSDFRAGQSVLIRTGQNAKTSIRAAAGLSLSGPGKFAEIRQDTPRHSRMTPLLLSPTAPSAAVQAPSAEQTSRPAQTRGAGQAYGAGQPNVRETHAAIENSLPRRGKSLMRERRKPRSKKLLPRPGKSLMRARRERRSINSLGCLSKALTRTG